MSFGAAAPVSNSVSQACDAHLISDPAQLDDLEKESDELFDVGTFRASHP
jgi:hypothetical protein